MSMHIPALRGLSSWRPFKRLLQDRRGNALIIAGLTLPLVVGAAGLGTDTIQWSLWKRELQRAADSAAFAGVYARVQNRDMTAAQAVDDDLAYNDHTDITLLSGYPALAYPTAAGWTHAVQVTLAIRKPLGFSGLFLSQPPTIMTSATAAVVEDGRYCVVALAPNGSGINIGGSADVELGCGAIANSQDRSDAVEVDGNAHHFVADPVAAVGGISSTINGSPNVRPNQLAMVDPFTTLSTAVPAGVTCTNYNHPSKSAGAGRINPGCYNNFNPGNGTTTLEPGVYYLNNTDLNLNGLTRLVGEGVTIILTGNNPGSVTMNGSSSMDLTAPQSGEYANILIVQSANAATGNTNKINGDNETALDGALYFPRGNIEFTGSTGQAFQCAMVAAYTLTFSGSSTIQNDTGDCDADITVTGRRVKLVA